MWWSHVPYLVSKTHNSTKCWLLVDDPFPTSSVLCPLVTRVFRHQTHSRRGGRRSRGRTESFVIVWRRSPSRNVLWEHCTQLHQGSEREGVPRRCVSHDTGSLSCAIISWESMDIFGSAFQSYFGWPVSLCSLVKKSVGILISCWWKLIRNKVRTIIFLREA